MGRAFEYRRAAKEKRWANMSRVFPKIGKMITVAAKEGGTDPDMNSKLRMAIAAAKAANMPKDNIEKAIKRAEGKDADTFVEVNYEGKGPHGILVYVECATDNTTRTVANVKSYFNKSGGSIAPSGSLDFLFDRKTVIEFKKPEGFERDDFELEFIDHGLEELQEDGDTIYAYGDYKDFGSLVKGLETASINIEKAQLERIPTAPADFSDEQMIDIQKMLDKFEDDEDVQNYFTNMA